MIDRSGSRRGGRARHLATALVLAGLSAGAATGLGFAGGIWWGFDLAAHFRVQYLLGLAAIAVSLTLLRRRRWATLFLLLGLVNLAAILPWLPRPESIPSTPGPSLRLMELNVHARNTRSDLVASEIARVDPDLLVLQEVNDRWIEELSGVTGTYDRAIVRSRDDNFGIGVFSRVGMEGRVVDLGGIGLPSVVARLTIGDGSLTVVATHPVPPYGRTGSALRDRQLAALGQLVAGLDGPVAVIGDLNTTPWSAPFRQLLAVTGLRDASRGRGIHPTWPAGRPWLWIPIDHCLLSPEVLVTDAWVGSDVGSDHYPLVVDIAAGDPGAPSPPVALGYDGPSLAAEESRGSTARTEDRAVPHRREDRRGRHGGGLPGRGPDARPSGGGQGPAGGAGA